MITKSKKLCLNSFEKLISIYFKPFNYHKLTTRTYIIIKVINTLNYS